MYVIINLLGKLFSKRCFQIICSNYLYLKMSHLWASWAFWLASSEITWTDDSFFILEHQNDTIGSIKIFNIPHLGLGDEWDRLENFDPNLDIFSWSFQQILWNSTDKILIFFLALYLWQIFFEIKLCGGLMRLGWRKKEVWFKIDKFVARQVLDPLERRRREPSGGTNYFAGTLS